MVKYYYENKQTENIFNLSEKIVIKVNSMQEV